MTQNTCGIEQEDFLSSGFSLKIFFLLFPILTPPLHSFLVLSSSRFSDLMLSLLLLRRVFFFFWGVWVHLNRNYMYSFSLLCTTWAHGCLISVQSWYHGKRTWDRDGSEVSFRSATWELAARSLIHSHVGGGMKSPKLQDLELSLFLPPVLLNWLETHKQTHSSSCVNWTSFTIIT